MTTEGCASKVVAQLHAAWGHQQVERLVMLGLGSVSASAPARYQLALGLVLARELLASGALLHESSTMSATCHVSHSLRFSFRYFDARAGELPLVYDPVFDAEDVAVLAALKCRVASEGEAQEVRKRSPGGSHVRCMTFGC